MRFSRWKGGIALFGLAILLGSAPAAARETGLTVKVVLESNEVESGEALAAAAVVANRTERDQLVLVEGFLSPVAEPIRTPPVSRWERFVYEILARISGDWELLHVPAGETRAVKLTIQVHPRVHGRFDVVATAHTQSGDTSGRASVIAKITAPPANGAVLVHGMVYELGTCRVLLTDDGHVYEPKGEAADSMFALLNDLYPRPDGVTVLGSILPNTLGCYGVELGVDVFRYDREPGAPVGVRWRHLSRGRTTKVYPGPDEEIIRKAARFREVVATLGAQITGRKPDFGKEMVAAVVASGGSLTTVRIGRILEREGTLEVHYTVTGPDDRTERPDILTETWHLVALPRFPGPVTFIRHDATIRTDAVRTGILDVAESLDLGGAKVLSAGGRLSRSLSRQERLRRRSAK